MRKDSQEPKRWSCQLSELLDKTWFLRTLLPHVTVLLSFNRSFVLTERVDWSTKCPPIQ